MSTHLYDAQQLERDVLRLAKQGKIKEALAHCQRLNARFPKYASGWYTFSQLAAKVRKPSIALNAIENAIRIDKLEPKWQLQKATCLMQMGRGGDARPILLELDKRPLKSAYQSSSMGLLLSRLDMNERALVHYKHAIKQQPDLGEHYYNAATVYRFLGQIDSAERMLTIAIEKSPEDFEAHKLRSDLRRQTPESNHIDALARDLKNYQSNPRAQVQLNYSLAKELEDIGDWQRSFSYLQCGADARRRLMRYELQDDLDTMAKIAEVYSPDVQANMIPGCDNAETIFILGMPRTGTTLIERVLGSHQQVHAAGELNNFAIEMTAAARKKLPTTGPRPSKSELVKLSATINFKELGEAYIASTRTATGELPRFIDKMPLNFLYAGLIHRALPRAKIIHLKRHPLDSCYAIYKTLFADAYPFSYQLEELARYYAAYDRLMTHWHKVMPAVIYDIHYEEVVADLEGQSRALLQYCDLEWENQCLRFYENRDATTTASATQVRQPVYSSSVGKWRHFATELQPLITVLRKEGVQFDVD